MEIVSSNILSHNITIVFKTLNLRSIDTRVIKELLGESILTDLPELMVFVDPRGPLVVQIGDRRLRVTYQSTTSELMPLWNLAHGSSAAIEHEIIAYGFNFDLGIRVANGSTSDITLGILAPNTNQISEIIGGELISAKPRFQFTRNETRYDLIVESPNDDELKFHLNAHFVVANNFLPPVDQMEESFLQEFGYLSSLVENFVAQVS